MYNMHPCKESQNHRSLCEVSSARYNGIRAISRARILRISARQFRSPTFHYWHSRVHGPISVRPDPGLGPMGAVECESSALSLSSYVGPVGREDRTGARRIVGLKTEGMWRWKYSQPSTLLLSSLLSRDSIPRIPSYPPSCTLSLSLSRSLSL